MLDYTALTPSVEKAAHIAASKFPDHHDINDVKQTLWVWVMENRNTVRGIVTDSKGSDEALVELLLRAANGYLKTEDAATYGYDQADQFNFSIDLIKNILEVVFTHEDWQSVASAIGDGMPRQKSEPATAGNNLASYGDVSRVVSLLSEDHYNLVIWRYKYKLTWEQVGKELGVTRQAAQQRHEVALKAIQRALGKKDLADFRRGFDGRTEARNSVSGQARVERDWDG